ncbi:MAG: hypothetical protein Q7J72_00100, partial [Candidatus Omnitrophota bacterium]|nr:hypothetical protein [Candidatus Omnitrophota bacterium]
KTKVDVVHKAFKHPSDSTKYLNLADTNGLDPDDIYILGYYDADKKTGYGLIYDENGSTRNPKETMKFFEASYDFIMVVRNGNFEKVFNSAYGTKVDFKNIKPEDLSLFATIIYDENGQLKSQSEIEEMFNLLPLVNTILASLKSDYISANSFINWTKGREFAISSLPPVLSLNPLLNKGYSDMEDFSNAVFTLASNMDWFLGELDTNNVDLFTFNNVYGLHSLKSDFKLKDNDYDLAGVLFMIISGTSGNFETEFNKNFGGVSGYVQTLPAVGDLIINLRGDPKYVESLNYFHNFNIPYSSNFSLNPRTAAFDLKNVGDFLFTKAGLINDGIYEDAESFLEMMAKIHSVWDKLGPVAIAPQNIGFDYRVMAGQVTIFVYDGYDFKTSKVNPYSLAKYAVTLVGDGDSLSDLSRNYTNEAGLIRDADNILSIARRTAYSEYEYTADFDIQYYLLDGKENYLAKETYDTLPQRGYLLKRVVQDKLSGYQLRTKYEYGPGRVILHSKRSMPVYVADTDRTYVDILGQPETDANLYSESENSVDVSAEKINKRVTFYSPNKVKAYELYRQVSLYAGNTLREEERDEATGMLYAYSTYTYDNAFMEALGLASRVERFAVDGERLSLTEFDFRQDIKGTSYGLSLVSRTQDFVTGLTIIRERDVLGKVYKETLSGRHINRETRNYFENPLYAGFGGIPLRSETVDLITGLKISRSRFLEFNSLGGVTLAEDLLVKNSSKIRVLDGRGNVRRLYEGENVAYRSGSITADTVVISEYEDLSWRARNISSSEKWSWDNSRQMKSGMITKVRPLAVETIVTHYGGHRVLEAEYYKPSVDTRMSVAVDLELGEPVRMATPGDIEYPRTAEVDYNSLGIEKASRIINPAGEELETTVSVLDEYGRPVAAKDAKGESLKSRLLKQWKKAATGEEKDIIQNLNNGLIDKFIPRIKLSGVEVTWQTEVKYDRQENEVSSDTFVYQNRVLMGKVKYTRVLDRKGELFPQGAIGDKERKLSAVYYLTAWGEEGVMLVDNYSGLLRGYRFENAEVAPGIIDTRESVIDYDEKEVFKRGVTYSQALIKQYPQGIFETRATSPDGLTQKFIDHTKGEQELTYTYNHVGRLLEVQSKTRKTRINYDVYGVETKSVTSDLRTNKTIITSESEHTFSLMQGINTVRLTVKTETEWFDYEKNIPHQKTVSEFNRYGSLISRVTFGADNINLRYEPVYSRGGIEMAANGYRILPGGERILAYTYSDYKWNKGELTRRTSDILHGYKEKIETIDAEGISVQEAEEFPLYDGQGNKIGTARRETAYIYDGSAKLGCPFIADKGKTDVEVIINNETVAKINFTESQTIGFQDGIITLKLTDLLRKLSWFEKKDILRRSRTTESYLDLEGSGNIRRTVHTYAGELSERYDIPLSSEVINVYPSGEKEKYKSSRARDYSPETGRLEVFITNNISHLAWIEIKNRDDQLIQIIDGTYNNGEFLKKESRHFKYEGVLGVLNIPALTETTPLVEYNEDSLRKVKGESWPVNIVSGRRLDVNAWNTDAIFDAKGRIVFQGSESFRINKHNVSRELTIYYREVKNNLGNSSEKSMGYIDANGYYVPRTILYLSPEYPRHKDEIKYAQFDIAQKSRRIVFDEQDKVYTAYMANATHLNRDDGSLEFKVKKVIRSNGAFFTQWAYNELQDNRGRPRERRDFTSLNNEKFAAGQEIWVTYFDYPWNEYIQILLGSRTYASQENMDYRSGSLQAQASLARIENDGQVDLIVYSLNDKRKGRDLQKEMWVTPWGMLECMVNDNAKVRVINGAGGYSKKGKEMVSYDVLENPLKAVDEEGIVTQEWLNIEYELTPEGSIKQAHTIRKPNSLGRNISHDYELTLVNGEFVKERRIGTLRGWGQDIWRNRYVVFGSALGGLSILLFIGTMLDWRRLGRAKKDSRKGRKGAVTPVPAPLAESVIPHPSYNAYGFDEGVPEAAKYKYTVIKERLMAREPLSKILDEYFESYRVWRRTALGRKDNFNPGIEDLWVFFLVNTGCGYFHNDTPSLFNYLLHNALEKKDNTAGVLVRKEYERWYRILSLCLSTFKGVGPPRADTSQLVPYHYLFSIDDLEEMFRTAKFVEFYSGLPDKEGVYSHLISQLRQKINNLSKAIKELNGRYGPAYKERIKVRLVKTQAYKDYVAFMTREWKKENPLFYKTYSDLVGIRFSLNGWLHSLRNNYMAVAFGLQIVLLASMLALAWQGSLFGLPALIVYALLEWLVWQGARKGLDLYLARALKKSVNVARYGRPVRPDEGYKKAPVAWQLKLFRISFWSSIIVIKLLWNALLLKYILIAHTSLWGAAWGPGFGIFNCNLFLVAGLWLPFVLFFFLDTFSIFYLMEAVVGYFHGKRLGLGIIKWGKMGYRKVSKNTALKDTLVQLIGEKFIAQESGLSDAQRLVATARIVNFIIDTLHEEDMITEEEKLQYGWVIRGEKKDNFLSGRAFAPDAFFSDAQNNKIRQRMSVFLNSLLMDIPNRPVWENIKTSTLLSPVGKGETLIYTYAPTPGMSSDDAVLTLDVRLKSGVTNLTNLIRRTPDEWCNFIERIEREGIATPDEIIRMKGLKLGVSLGKVNKDLEWEIRLWASFRFQPFVRTLRGLIHYVSALRLYARLDHPEWNMDKVNDEVNRKFQLLWAHQGYGDYIGKDIKAEETRSLLEYYYNKYGYLIDIVYLQERGPAGNKCWYNVLARLNPVSKNIDDICAVKLTECFPIVSEGKAGNQTNSRRFARGEIILAMDMNQDFYVEETLKLPHLLSLYGNDPDVAVVGYPEDIFTDTYTLMGKFHAIADRTFVTIVQRVLALLGCRFHYGHPDAIRASCVDKFGGLSRSYPVNEDIFLGYEMALKGKKILFVEWIEAGKAREVAWGTTFGIWIKFGMGAAQQFYNRYLYYLNSSRNFGWLERIAHFYGGIGFYFRKPWVVWGNLSYAVLLLFMGVSGFAAFPCEIFFAIYGLSLFAQAITFTGFMQYITERPFIRASFGFVLYWFAFAPFFMAHVFSYAQGVNSAMKGVATYMATGRGFMLEHTKVSEISKSYTRIHIFNGILGTAFCAAGIIIWWNPSLILSLPFIAIMVSAMMVPFLTNKAGLPLFGVGLRGWWKLFCGDFRENIKFIKGEFKDGRKYHDPVRWLWWTTLYVVSFVAWLLVVPAPLFIPFLCYLLFFANIHAYALSHMLIAGVIVFLFPVVINLVWKGNNKIKNRGVERVAKARSKKTSSLATNLLQDRVVIRNLRVARNEINKLILDEKAKDNNWQRLSQVEQTKYLADARAEVLSRHKGRQLPLFINTEIEDIAKDIALIDSQINIISNFMSYAWAKTSPGFKKQLLRSNSNDETLAKDALFRLLDIKNKSDAAKSVNAMMIALLGNPQIITGLRNVRGQGVNPQRINTFIRGVWIMLPLNLRRTLYDLKDNNVTAAFKDLFDRLDKANKDNAKKLVDKKIEKAIAGILNDSGVMVGLRKVSKQGVNPQRI